MSRRVEQSGAWIYQGLWAVLARWFRVPQEPPTLPVAPGGLVESFQPGPAYLGYLKFIFWVVLVLADLGFTAAYIAIATALVVGGYWWAALLLLPVALFVIVAPDVVAYVAIHLRYDTTWYVLTDRSMRIRRGIMVIRETTLTFENVQNVKVTQGPLERWFGISRVVVETAGGAGVKGPHGESMGGHQGVIEGIADAARIRDLILSRVRRSKTTGLGDEEHGAAASQSPAWTGGHVGMLRDLLTEARGLAEASVLS